MNLRALFPEFIKRAIRFLYYSEERRRVVREIAIRRTQNELISKYDPQTKKLIVFLVQGADWSTGKDRISGGAMSIVSICEETVKLKNVHHAETVMCTHTQDNLMVQYTTFENQTSVFRFSQLPEYFTNVEEVLIHVPEYRVAHVGGALKNKEIKWLQKRRVHLNIVNQNIRFMPAPTIIRSLHRFCDEVTITTAHQKYCSNHYRNFYGVPLHKLSTWVSPEQYKFRTWSEKENLLVVSPDQHVLKESVLTILNKVPGLTVQIIQNLSYQEYKELISRAKWSLTFGEGLDGYLVEPVFSGAIGFAVYNEEFFTPDFASLPGIYPSMDHLIANLSTDITAMDNEVDFSASQSQQFKLCAYYYSKAQYQQNIISFYQKQYTYA